MCQELAQSDVTEVISALLCIAVQYGLSEMIWQWRLKLSLYNTKYVIGVGGR